MTNQKLKLGDVVMSGMGGLVFTIMEIYRNDGGENIYPYKHNGEVLMEFKESELQLYNPGKDFTAICPECKGHGRIEEKFCKNCNGRGKIKEGNK